MNEHKYILIYSDTKRIHIKTFKSCHTLSSLGVKMFINYTSDDLMDFFGKKHEMYLTRSMYDVRNNFIVDNSIPHPPTTIIKSDTLFDMINSNDVEIRELSINIAINERFGILEKR